MPFASPRHDSLPKQALRGLVFLATIAIILAGLWTAGAAILENMRFAQATSQLLHLISVTHDYAASNKNFAMKPDEDLLSALSHASMFTGVNEGTPATLPNPWKGYITVMSASPSHMRVEAHLPARDCRRLALFFVKNGSDLNLNVGEAHADGEKIWQRFYDRNAKMLGPSNQRVEDACKQGESVTLALIFGLR